MATIEEIYETVPNNPAIQMVWDPVEFFEGSYTCMQSVPIEEVSKMQLEALKWRFGMLRDRIPYLKKLADKQGMDADCIEEVFDIVPLMFEHTVFKSYPPSLIDRKRFDQLTLWLDKLTTHDLSDVDAAGCQSISEWMALLDEQTPLRVAHSSGTTGSFSILPWSKEEWERHGMVELTTELQLYGEKADSRKHQGMPVIYPYFEEGYQGAIRVVQAQKQAIAKTDENFYAPFPGQRLDSDVMHLAGRLRAAKAKGNLQSLKVDPELLKRKEEFDELLENMPEHLEAFLEETVQKLKGQRVYLCSTWNILYNLARAGLDKGMRKVFAPDSILLVGGGAKGMVPPDDWKEVILEFVGASRFGGGYGMSELSMANIKCVHGNCHTNPWVIPFVLDPDTTQPLPGKGVQKGRAAFFDLSARTRWGGFITGDEVTVHWTKDCPCGSPTTYIEDNVTRLSESRGGDDKITCAATADAHKDAMEFLNSHNISAAYE